MLNIKQFREYIIRPTLHDLILNSNAAEELLVFTCANESFGGTYIKQQDGPALGIFQMEPFTYNDIWHMYIFKNPKLALILATNFNAHMIPDEQRLIFDLRFATAMARIHYARFNEPLPHETDIDGIWQYYKKYYNTSEGKADKVKAIANYLKFSRS